MTQNILVLAANPIDTPRLRLDQEVREITDGLQRAQRREEFVLRQQWAVRPVDVRRAMLDFGPQIVHFCGHGGGEEGIAFEDEKGKTKLVSAEALAGFFELFADKVECVVLNACYSEVQAEVIAQHIGWVIGMKRGIGDAAAIEFAIAFYDALGAGKSIDFAYRLACNAIHWANIPEHLTPILKSKRNPIDQPQHVEAKYEETFTIFGSLFVEKDGKEDILVYIDPTDPMRTYKFPIVERYDPQLNTVEQAIGGAVRNAIEIMGMDLRKIQEVGFSNVFHYRLYEVRESPRYPGRGRVAFPLPYIFFKIKLHNQVQPRNRKSYYWLPKSQAVKQWEHEDFNQWNTNGELNSKSLLKLVNYNWLVEEIGFKVLECVDTLIFRQDEHGVIRFLMIYRKSHNEGWEYPKGGLNYHETYLEGALREIREETGIDVKQLVYCADLGWQTPNVADRNEFYDTLRVHCFVFQYIGKPEEIHLRSKHTQFRWMSFAEARKNIWMRNYGPQFFDRWKQREDEILHKAGIIQK